MKCNVFFLLLAFGALSFSFTKAQNTEVKLTDIIPPSPQAQAFHKYGDYPVSHNTGVPDITIPIYEINTGRLSLPISIKFHPSGFRPTDRDGILGLGWSLHAGGQISRQIRGLADDMAYGILDLGGNPRHTVNTIGQVSNTNAFSYLRGLEERSMDGEYDIFSYGVIGNSGNFILRQMGTGTTSNIQPFFLNNKKTERLLTKLNGTTNRIEYFDYTNDLGQLFRFGKSVKDNTLAYERTDPNSNPYSGNSITSWLLTEIISEDRSDTIRFTYKPLEFTTISTNSIITSVRSHVQSPVTGNPNSYTESTASQSSSNGYWTTSIREIFFKDGRLLFNYSQDNKWLTSIDLFDANNTKIRTFSFFTSSYGTGSTYNALHYKLDSLMVGNNNNFIYRFDYYNTQQTNYAHLSQDWWGYYNGGAFSGSMTPYMILPDGFAIGNSNVSRDPDEIAKNLMLKEIHYPTGGTTSFEYELNQYKDGTQLKNAGGLRIHRIINNGQYGNTNIKIFKYGENEDGAGEVIIKPLPANLIARSRSFLWPPADGTEFSRSTITTLLNFLPSRTNFGASVYYNQVTEYDGNISNNNGKIVYKYGIMPGLPFAPATNALSEYFSFYNFYAAPAPLPLMPPGEEEVFSQERYGLLLEKLTYKREGSNYTLIQKDSNNYEVLNISNAIDMRVGRYGKHTKPGSPDFEYDLVVNNFGFPGSTEGNPPPYVYRSHSIYSGYVALKSKFIRKYENNGTFEHVKEYSYNNQQHTYPTSITERTSTALLKYSNYSRPLDLLGGFFTDIFAKQAVDSMIKRNILAPVLEEVDGVFDPMVENTLTYSVRRRTDYNVWDLNGNNIKPIRLIMTVGAYDPEVRLLFDKYDDKGNLLEQGMMNDIKHAYLWGTNLLFPIAEVVNAQYNKIAYTSFEGDKGNWNYQGAPELDASSVTGHRAYSVDNGNISSATLPVDNYFVSWWGKSATTLVNGIVGIPLISRNGWTLYHCILPQVTSVTISGTGIIDELRLYPEKASMKTFTYEPLVGLTSQGEVNGLITYYVYDNMGRLIRQRDQEGNVLKQIEYQYQK